MPSEVVSQKTSQGASHVSVRRGFRRRLSATMKDDEIPRCCMASVRQGALEKKISTKSHRSTTATSSTD